MNIPTESHPLKPFLPEGARLLMLGSFPPKRERWSMEFFYPNWINDMWRIWAHIFFQDRRYFDIPDENEYYLHRIGRTGRAKRKGAAYTFATKDDRFRIRDIKKYTRSEMAAVSVGADGTLTPVAENEETSEE